MSRNTAGLAVINTRLKGQRMRIFQVQGIVGAVSSAAHAATTRTLTEEERQRFASDAWMALEHIHELLEGIAGDLEPAVMLDTDPQEEPAAA